MAAADGKAAIHAKKFAHPACVRRDNVPKIWQMSTRQRKKPEEAPLSRRERQLMDVAHRLGRMTAREAQAELPDSPAYSTVRTLLGVLVRKGWLKARLEGKALVYTAAERPQRAAESALRRVVRTFFQGSVANAVSGLLSLREAPLPAEEIERLEHMLAEAKKEADHE